MMIKSLFLRLFRNRVHTPAILQMENTECGAASLAIILAYYKRFVSLTELREACGVSANGTDAFRIVTAAESYGLIAKGYSLEVENLRALQAPFMVFWEFNHFLIVEGITKDKVYLNDPASGHRSVTLNEFSQAFTGVTLTFEPSSRFKKEGQPPNFIPTLMRRLKGNKKTVLFLFLIGIVLVLPGLFCSLFIKQFIDQFLTQNNLHFLPFLFIGIVCSIVLQAVLVWLKNYYLSKFEIYLSIRESAKIFWHVLNLPMRFFSQRYAGDIANRVHISDVIAEVLAQDVLFLFLNLVTLILYSLVMFYYNVTLTFVFFSIAGLNFFILKMSAKYQTAINQSLVNVYGKLYGASMHGIQLLETLKSCGLESEIFSNIIGYYAKYQNIFFRSMRISSIFNAIFSLIPSLNIIIISILGGYFLMRGQMTSGDLIALMGLVTYVLNPFANIFEIFTKIQKIQGDMLRLDDVLTYETEKTLPAIDSNLNFSGQLDVKNVSFGYDKQVSPILSEISFTIKPGQLVGVIGFRKSGRSTLAQLIMDLQKPWEGEILFDGLHRFHYDQATLNKKIGFVEQSMTLFSGTVLENLSMWDRDIPEKVIIQAAKDAEIHDLISQRDGGYETYVEEGGINFSGGERQRLEIARALVHNPRLLILDEATSALDYLVEDKILTNIKNRNCTSLIFTQRISVLKKCDEVILLDQGKIAQKAPHAELIKDKSGLYYSFVAQE